MSRKIVPIALLALACILLILGVSLNAIIEKNRGQIQEEIQKSLGRSVAFGELRLSFWGGIGLSAKEVQIAEDPRFAATPFVQTKELKMQLRWLPLLTGKFQINKFILDEPEIQIIKNETGTLNIATLSSREKKPKGPHEVKEKKGPSAPRFLISAVGVKNGSVDYIDRSSKEPVEVRVRKVDLDVKGRAINGTAKVKLTASLFEGQGQNLSVEGRVGPLAGERDWTQVPLDLQLRCDSLLLPQLTRAIPILREKIARYIDATGPFAFQAKLLGTIERPHITDLNLTGPFFGATANNTSVKGDLDFSRGGSWAEGEVKTQIVIDPLPLDRLKSIPFFRQALPSSLVSEGPVSIASELQGNFGGLKIHATIKGKESEIRYGNWLKKDRGVPVEIELQMERQKERLIFQESSIMMHNSKLKFSGSLDQLPERRLTLQLRTDGFNFAGWDKLLPPLSGYSTAGNLRWDLSIKKSLAAEGALEVRGSLNLDDVQARDKKSGRGVERATARITFRGKDARVEQLALRTGSSDITLEGTVADLVQPTLRYSLRSAKLNLADLTGAPAYKGDEMKSLASSGELQIKDGKTLIHGSVSSSEGTLQDVPYRNFRGEVAWSPASLSFKNLSFQAMNGNFRATGSWDTSAEESLRLTLDPNIESMDLKTLLAQKFPRFKDHIDGQLNFKAKLKAESKNISGLPEGMEGDGETQLRNGSLKDFNLMQLVLSKVSGMPGIGNLRIPPRFTALAQRKDTPFDSLTATFTIKQGRIHSKDLLLSTLDYSVSAEGSIGLDKSMKWNATLTMSPQFTQELVKEYKNVRYMVDRQGRLSVPFRVEGALPHVQVKPDLQKLVQSIQKGLFQKETAPSAEGEKEPKKKERRPRIPKELEQLLGK